LREAGAQGKHGDRGQVSRFKIGGFATKEEIGTPTALAAERIQQWLEGKTIRKIIVVPGRLVVFCSIKAGFPLTNRLDNRFF
jgi:leucyl-tRNA synthetase